MKYNFRPQYVCISLNDHEFIERYGDDNKLNSLIKHIKTGHIFRIKIVLN